MSQFFSKNCLVSFYLISTWVFRLRILIKNFFIYIFYNLFGFVSSLCVWKTRRNFTYVHSVLSSEFLSTKIYKNSLNFLNLLKNLYEIFETVEICHEILRNISWFQRNCKNHSKGVEIFQFAIQCIPKLT